MNAKEVQEIFPEIIEKLKTFIAIPSISFDSFEREPLFSMAALLEKEFESLGIKTKRLLPKSEIPAIYGELPTKKDNPTILLYAHYDVQPPMREALWKSPPFQAEIRENRLYGRGSADDKAGILIHLFAAKLAQKHLGENAPNLKFLIEGEEESGSAGFEEILEKNKELLRADCAIIADLGNFSLGEPSLTTTLRGMSAIEVEIRGMRSPLHSGSWSGPIPDPVQELCRLISTLTDGNGNILIEDFLEGLKTPSREEEESLFALGMDEKKFRREARLLDSTQLLVSEKDILRTLWRKPSIVVTAFEAGSKTQAGNVLQESAYARLSIRTAPGMDSTSAVEKLTSHLKKNVRHGLTLSIKKEDGAEAFTTDTSHPYFSKMKKSMEEAFEKKARAIGCGASIPAAEIFRKSLGDIPILMTGVEDPECLAHGENESLYLPDFEKAILAEALFFKELSI